MQSHTPDRDDRNKSVAVSVVMAEITEEAVEVMINFQQLFLVCGINFSTRDLEALLLQPKK